MGRELARRRPENPNDLLIEAARRGRSPDLCLALMAGADPDARTNPDPEELACALAIAFYRGNAATQDILLAAGATPGSMANWRDTILTGRGQRNDLRGMQKLIAHGAAVDQRNENQETALMRVASAGRTEAMELLLAHGADPDARDRRGATALGHAAATDRVEMVEALLRAGARADIVDDDGRTALDIARDRRSRASAALLEAVEIASALPLASAPEPGEPLEAEAPGASAAPGESAAAPRARSRRL